MRNFPNHKWFILLCFVCSAAANSFLTVKAVRLEVELSEWQQAADDAFALASCELIQKE
jgi:activator of 2-hydroxyglutaryl-CoA dehydratase